MLSAGGALYPEQGVDLKLPFIAFWSIVAQGGLIIEQANTAARQAFGVVYTPR